MKDKINENLLQLNCNTCQYQKMLNVYTLERTPELLGQLSKQEIYYTCTGFLDEDVIDIGKFSGLGCEMWFKRTEKQQKSFEKTRTEILTRLYSKKITEL